MPWNLYETHARAGDLALLVGNKHKRFILRLIPGAQYQSHRGILKHDDLIGKVWGATVASHKGSAFTLLTPSLGDLIQTIRRNTQILYPKDIGFILMTLGIGPGQHVVEAGTGSGALTTAFAYLVGEKGRVTTYEVRPEIQRMAMANLERVDLTDRVEFKLKDIGEGFDETNVDSIFLDLPNPYDYVGKVKQALKPGGFFGCILPTANQVTLLLGALRQERFAFIDVVEVLLRYYQAEPDRFRPVDRMIAHTGFLIFARPVSSELPDGLADEGEDVEQTGEIELEEG